MWAAWMAVLSFADVTEEVEFDAWSVAVGLVIVGSKSTDQGQALLQHGKVTESSPFHVDFTKGSYLILYVTE